MVLSQKWTGDHFTRKELRDMGLNIQLGHAGGHCESPVAPVDLLVFHTTGPTTISVMYCGCKTTGAQSHYIQLLRSCLYPASLKHIKTVFTFDVLNHFHELNVQAKTTAYDYYNTLLRQADLLQLKPQPVSILSNRFTHHSTISITMHSHS